MGVAGILDVNAPKVLEVGLIFTQPASPHLQVLPQPPRLHRCLADQAARAVAVLLQRL